MVEVDEIRYQSLVSLRVSRNDIDEAVYQIGLAAPLTRSNADPNVAWIGPDHWLLISDTLNATEIIERCDVRLAKTTHNATDSTDALIVFRLRGLGVRDLLSSASGLDFRADAFLVGTCQRTRFAQIPVSVCAVEIDEFELIFDRTYSSYLTSWIHDTNTTLQIERQSS